MAGARWHHLKWPAPLFDRITVGWVVMWSGWAENDICSVTELVGWELPFPPSITP